MFRKKKTKKFYAYFLALQNFWYFSLCSFSSDIFLCLSLPYFLSISFSSDKVLYLFFACSLNTSLLFYNIPLLYIILFLCFFDNKLFHSFLYNVKKIMIGHFFKKSECFIIFIASYLLMY